VADLGSECPEVTLSQLAFWNWTGFFVHVDRFPWIDCLCGA